MTDDTLIDRLLLFGGTGDLASRYVLPALAALHAAGELPDGFSIVATGRQPYTDAEFRAHVGEQLRRHAPEVPAASREAIKLATGYQAVDVDDPASVARVVAEATSGDHARPVAAYLALPPGLFAGTVRSLCDAGLPLGSRVVVEKPFGEDLDSAVELNTLLEQACGGDDRGAFRIDHFLGHASVQNLLGMRVANRLLDPVWNSTHIEQIDIVWEETLALEDRAAYYDGVGQLRDMIQNHLLQVLCLLAMEPPKDLAERELHGHKIALLRAVRPPAPQDMATLTRRARYTAGQIGDRHLSSYVDEPGVDLERGTETFAEVTFHIDNERWRGTPFVVRTAKALGGARMEVVVHFRPATTEGAGSEFPGARSNEFRLAINDHDGEVTLRLNGAAAGSPPTLEPLVLRGQAPDSSLPPYSRVLLDILSGGAALSVGGEEAEEAWRIVDPVLTAWGEDRVAMLEYPAGSQGPPT